MESREKRKVEKPRLPRTAKKIETKKMKVELGQIGLEVEHDEDVSAQFNFSTTMFRNVLFHTTVICVTFYHMS